MQADVESEAVLYDEVLQFLEPLLEKYEGKKCRGLVGLQVVTAAIQAARSNRDTVIRMDMTLASMADIITEGAIKHIPPESANTPEKNMEDVD